ncbi:MAG: DNA-binding protein WhiA [Christensenellaceae bacterium]|jgi:DNA-binding protein WhiA
MTFSTEAKNEICAQGIDDCCVAAELVALTFSCGSISLSAAGMHIKYNTENMLTAKRIFSTVTRILKIDAGVEVKESQLKKKHMYTIDVPDAALLLSAMELSTGLLAEEKIPAELTGKRCCKIAFLRGAFLGCGTVSDPKKNYHLEFVLRSERIADKVLQLLAFFKVSAKKVLRKQSFVVYLSEGDSIVSLLALIGAHTSILNFENVRILKEMRNNVNRAVNCETANINKTVNAALKQIENIRIIGRHMDMKYLSPALREAAELRISNPEATLQELCELSGTTKSGMNHRFRKLNQIAESFAHEKEDIL